MIITVKDLKNKAACKAAIKEFIKKFGEQTDSDKIYWELENRAEYEWLSWFASNFNQPLPEGFTCGGDFHCGDSFNQPLPKGFTCGGIFFRGSKFNYSLPKKAVKK